METKDQDYFPFLFTGYFIFSSSSYKNTQSKLASSPLLSTSLKLVEINKKLYFTFWDEHWFFCLCSLSAFCVKILVTAGNGTFNFLTILPVASTGCSFYYSNHWRKYFHSILHYQIPQTVHFDLWKYYFQYFSYSGMGIIDEFLQPFRST